MRPESEASAAAAYSFVIITEKEYFDVHLPHLQTVVNHILTTNSKDFVSLSFENIYSAVYKCVCSQFSDRLFSDVMQCIREYLYNMVNSIREVQLTEFIQYFSNCLIQYRRSLEQLAHIFNYLIRHYVELEKSFNFNKLLLLEFTVIVADPYIKQIIDLLSAAKSRPFTVAPNIMANVVTSLYLLEPEYSKLDPQLFAIYIPNVLPPMCESDIPKYTHEIKCLEQQMIHEGYTREPNPFKRPFDETDFQNETADRSGRRPEYPSNPNVLSTSLLELIDICVKTNS